MKKAESPFQFATVSYLTRIRNQTAKNLGELRAGLETCSDASIFYHTFQSLGRHHFLTDGFSNDIAQWVLAGLNRMHLAEQLAALDIRDYTDLRDLRNDMLRVTDEFCAAHPTELDRPAFEPFYFCETIEVMLPSTLEAATLEDFRHAMEHLSNGAFYYHFVISRLRLQLRTNDFSEWFANELGLETLARRTDRIDIYTNTLESTRAKLVQYVERELAA